ncbi:Zinc finger protein plag1 [Halocaridina rubra]|uniref:Zinc finger protein plag1 n=1 Tax=Halocaridina rubra TaxID=373956 RepID=A0AAN8XA80_HALRR
MRSDQVSVFKQVFSLYPQDPPLTWRGNPENHQCPHCFRYFTDRYKRDRHLLIHTGEKPFQCPFCQYRASRKDPVIRHIKFKHTQQFTHLFSPPTSATSNLSNFTS